MNGLRKVREALKRGHKEQSPTKTMDVELNRQFPSSAELKKGEKSYKFYIPREQKKPYLSYNLTKHLDPEKL